MKPITFALFFGNRGFFPEALIAGARQQIQSRLEKLGYRTLAMPVSLAGRRRADSRSRLSRRAG